MTWPLLSHVQEMCGHFYGGTVEKWKNRLRIFCLGQEDRTEDFKTQCGRNITKHRCLFNILLEVSAGRPRAPNSSRGWELALGILCLAGSMSDPHLDPDLSPDLGQTLLTDPIWARIRLQREWLDDFTKSYDTKLTPKIFYSDSLYVTCMTSSIGSGGGAVAKYAIPLLFYCLSNIMPSACLRSHWVPAYFVSLGVSDAYIAPRNRTPDHHGDPQCSDFKFQTALLTVISVISHRGIAVFCRRPIECFLVGLPNFNLRLYCHSGGSSYYR